MANLVGLAKSKKELEQVIKNFTNLADRSTVDTTEINDVIQSLSSLQKDLEQSARDFFKNFTWAKGDLQQDFDTFQKKFDELNENTGFMSMSNSNKYSEMLVKKFTGNNQDNFNYDEYIDVLFEDEGDTIGKVFVNWLDNNYANYVALDEDSSGFRFESQGQGFVRLHSKNDPTGPWDALGIYALTSGKTFIKMNTDFKEYLNSSSEYQKFAPEVLKRKDTSSSGFKGLGLPSEAAAKKALENVSGIVWQMEDFKKVSDGKYQFKFTGKPSSTLKNAIEDLGMKLVSNVGISEEGKTGDPRTNLINTLRSDICSGPNGDLIWSYVEPQLKDKDNFAFGTHIANFVGFLGEVKATAFLNYLAGTGYGATEPPFVVPAGTMKLLKDNWQSGQEIPIDVFFRSCGFQVKNYTLTNDNYVYMHEAGMDTILNDHFRAGQTVKDIIYEFFGNEFWNMINSDNPFRNEMLDDFENTRGRFSDIGQPYIPRLMGIDKTFGIYVKGKNGIVPESTQNYFDIAQELGLTKNDLKYNTFFIINERIIPASKIVGALIDELQNKTNKTVNVNFSVDNWKRKQNRLEEKLKNATTKDSKDEIKNKIKEYGTYMTSFKKGHTEIPPNIMELVKLLETGYNVRLNLGRVLANATSR